MGRPLLKALHTPHPAEMGALREAAHDNMFFWVLLTGYYYIKQFFETLLVEEPVVACCFGLRNISDPQIEVKILKYHI